MNKKLIISLVVAGLVIGGAIYIYQKNKKPKVNTDNNTNGMATETDALQIAEILGKKDQPIPVLFMKTFVDLYTKNINKDLHKSLVVITSKKESEWTAQEKLDMSVLINKVFLPLTKQIGQPK